MILIRYFSLFHFGWYGKNNHGCTAMLQCYLPKKGRPKNTVDFSYVNIWWRKPGLIYTSQEHLCLVGIVFKMATLSRIPLVPQITPGTTKFTVFCEKVICFKCNWVVKFDYLFTFFIIRQQLILLELQNSHVSVVIELFPSPSTAAF